MYAFQAHLAVVRVDPISKDVKILKYVVIHDSGKMYKKEFVDGQIRGGVFQGIAAALYEELAYGGDGQPMVLTWSDYESPPPSVMPCGWPTWRCSTWKRPPWRSSRPRQRVWGGRDHDG